MTRGAFRDSSMRTESAKTAKFSLTTIVRLAMTVMHAKNVDQVILQIIENALTVKTGLRRIVSFVQLEVVQHVAKDGSLVMDNVKSVDL